MTVVEPLVLTATLAASIGLGYAVNKAALTLLLRAMGLHKRT